MIERPHLNGERADVIELKRKQRETESDTMQLASQLAKVHVVLGEVVGDTDKIKKDVGHMRQQLDGIEQLIKRTYVDNPAKLTAATLAKWAAGALAVGVPIGAAIARFLLF